MTLCKTYRWPRLLWFSGSGHFTDQIAFHDLSYANNQPIEIDNQAHDLVATDEPE